MDVQQLGISKMEDKIDALKILGENERYKIRDIINQGNSGIYSFVDEDFMQGFSKVERDVVEDAYKRILKSTKCKIGDSYKSLREYFLNAKRQQKKLIQLCCPFCGKVELIYKKISFNEISKMQHCLFCGKGNMTYNIFSQISSYIVADEIIRAGLRQENSINVESLDLLESCARNMEIVQAATILETILRDSFFALLSINSNNTNNGYINRVIHNSTRNDFMNIDKANNHYKKALSIQLKKAISESDFQNLRNLLNVRNAIVHNNGLADQTFLSNNTLNFFKDLSLGDRIMIDEDFTLICMNSVLEMAFAINRILEKDFKNTKHKIIADYYYSMARGNGDIDHK